MVISKKDKQKFKKAMSAKSSTQETTKRGRGRPSKVEKLDKKVDYSLPKDKRVIWDGIIDTQEEITKEIVIPDLKETLVEEKVQEEIKQDEGTEISEQVPNFLDEEEVQEAISERKDELSSQREELEEVKEDFEDIELDETDELDLSDLKDETVKEKEDEIVVEEVKEASDDIEDLDLSDFEDEIIEEKTSVETIPEPIETQEIQEEIVVKEEVKEEDKVEDNKEKEEKAKSGFMDMWNKNKNYVIIGAVALVIAWAGIFAFKDKIFWNEQPVKPVVQEQTPVEQNTEEKEKEKQPEIKETPTVDLFTKAELTEENKLILNKLVPMSLSLEKGLQEIYDAKKTNETNHWIIKNYDKKHKKTSIVDIQTQINQNLQDIKWVDDAEDDLVKGKSDTDSEGNELSPEEKMKRENNPALSVKKYNWDEGDIKGEIKTSLTIKQGKEKKYGFKINADVEGKKDTTYMFFKNFGINTKDQDLIDKSELDKFSLQNKMLTVSDEKENKEMLGLLGEYRTQLLGFNFLANILNNSEVEGSDEPVQFVDTKEVDEDTEEETTPVVEKKTKKKELVTTSTNGVKEEKPEVEEKEVKEELKETSDEKEKVDTTIENKEDTNTKEDANTKETDETKEVKDEEKDNLKASYKIKVSGNTIKEELQNILRVKESLTKVFLENGTNSPLNEFVEAIKEEDTLIINYDTKENKALVSWELAGYSVKGVIGDKEEIVLTKDGKETKITLTLTDILVKAKITSAKEETVFESGLLAKDGIYKTHFLFSKDLIKKNGKKTNVYKLSNKGVLAKDNEQLPVYAKEYTKENLKGKYEVNFNFITTEYNKLIEKAFGVKEDNKEKETVVEEKEKDNKEVVKNEEKAEENKKETEKKEVKVEEKNSKEEKAKNPVKEVFKEVEKEDAKAWAGAVAEQPK